MSQTSLDHPGETGRPLLRDVMAAFASRQYVREADEVAAVSVTPPPLDPQAVSPRECRHEADSQCRTTTDVDR